MADVRIEFLVEPFSEGSPGPHVLAGVEAVRQLGHEPEVGPFGTVVVVDPAAAGALTGAMVDASLAHGASRVALQIEVVDQ
jgi:uncharacterized protein YqgV (UPF0045/DUF77 family)